VPNSKIFATLALPQGVIVRKASMCVKKRNCPARSSREMNDPQIKTQYPNKGGLLRVISWFVLLTD
jgi:hypothetical protein